MHVVDLTMAVRLLWSPSGPNLVYRGVDAANFNAAEYEQALASGLHVFWYSFSSTSTDRHHGIGKVFKTNENTKIHTKMIKTF